MVVMAMVVIHFPKPVKPMTINSRLQSPISAIFMGRFLSGFNFKVELNDCIFPQLGHPCFIVVLPKYFPSTSPSFPGAADRQPGMLHRYGRGRWPRAVLRVRRVPVLEPSTRSHEGRRCFLLRLRPPPLPRGSREGPRTSENSGVSVTIGVARRYIFVPRDCAWHGRVDNLAWSYAVRTLWLAHGGDDEPQLSLRKRFGAVP